MDYASAVCICLNFSFFAFFFSFFFFFFLKSDNHHIGELLHSFGGRVYFWSFQRFLSSFCCLCKR